jgi:hypothetical protein
MSAPAESYWVSWDEANEIARLDWAPGAVGDLATAQLVDRDVQDLGQGPVRLLVDLRPVGSIDRDAREFFISLSPHYRAVALLAGSPATRMLANFFLGFKRGDMIPVRVFTSETDAVDWLRSNP